MATKLMIWSWYGTFSMVSGEALLSPQKVTPLTSMKLGCPSATSLAYDSISESFQPLTTVSLYTVRCFCGGENN